jgi:hypothetical protein
MGCLREDSGLRFGTGHAVLSAIEVVAYATRSRDSSQNDAMRKNAMFTGRGGFAHSIERWY